MPCNNVCIGSTHNTIPPKHRVTLQNVEFVLLKFSVCVKERQDRLPTMYWLPKLHKTPYKARFIANSSSCTTTELSKLLTSCLTAVKNHVIRYCEKVYERSGKNLVLVY